MDSPRLTASRVPLAAFGVVAGLWVVVALLGWTLGWKAAPFVALAALFAGLGLAALVMILLRMQETSAHLEGILEQQREVLLAMRGELLDQRQLLATFTRTEEERRFEETFLRHLAIIAEIAASSEYARQGGNRESGRKAFQAAVDDFRTLYETGNQFRKLVDPERLHEAWKAFREHLFDTAFPSYLRATCVLLESLDSSPLDEVRRRTLAQLLFHRMSLPEQVLVHYAAISTDREARGEAVLARHKLHLTIPSQRLIKPEHAA